MAPRAVWTGQIRLSLVSIGVEIYSATSSSGRVSFRQIHEPSGKRVRSQKVVEGIGPVDRDEIVKGYPLGEGDYVIVAPEEIEEIKLETKKTFELVQFVAQGDIPPLYYDKPYYVVPSDDLAEDAYRVLREALRSAGKVGLGQIAMRGKEYLAAVRPCGDGLLLETLHYAEEIRNAEPMFSEVGTEEPEEELLNLAGELIEKKTKPFDAAAYTDSYAEALRDLIAAKRKDEETHVIEGAEAKTDGDNVVDLMSALKKSVGEGEGDGKDKRKSKSKKSGGGKKAKGKTPGKSKKAS